MKYIGIALLFISINEVSGQNSFAAVNRDEVEKAINNSSASTYYPVLLSKFQHFDTTLTNDDYRLLYYGFVFQKGYTGYPDQKQKEIRAAMDAKNYTLVSAICDTVLQKIPVSLVGNFYKGLALFSISHSDTSYIGFRDRYQKLLNAIVSSGDGLSCKTAFKTIFVTDEYRVMYNYFEIEDIHSQSLEYPCDRMAISPSKYFKEKSMYFNTSETLLYMEKNLKKSKFVVVI